MAASIKLESLARFLLNHNKCVVSGAYKRMFSITVANLNVDTEKDSLYPPIRGKYPPGKWGELPNKVAWKLHEKGNEYDRIFNIRERLEAMGEEHNYTLVRAYSRYPDAFMFKQYITKTNVVHDDPPKVLTDLNVDNECEHAKTAVLNSILLQHDQFNVYKDITENKDSKDWQDTQQFLESLINNIMCNISSNHPHLLFSQSDDQVPVNTFWARTGYGTKETPAKGKWFGQFLTFYYDHPAFHQIRVEQPAPLFWPEDHDYCEAPSVEYPYAPKLFGQKLAWTRPKSVSGHWLGDPCEFCQVSFCTLGREHLRYLNLYGDEMTNQALAESAVTSAFASCVAQAHNQGFHMFHDITYPITTQTVAYGGGKFYFCAFQLNTIQLWKDDKANPKSNVAFISGPHRLYETVTDGKVIGFNEDTLRMLLKCFALKPVDRGIDLRPNAPGPRPLDTELYINHKGTPPIEKGKLGRWDMPRDPIYPFTFC